MDGFKAQGRVLFLPEAVVAEPVDYEVGIAAWACGHVALFSFLMS